ncbi:MAG: phage portal protein [Tannerellaceae bacterium]
MPDIATILQEPDFKKVAETLCQDTIEGREQEVYLKEYNGDRTRREASVGNREDKQIDVYSDTESEIDENGKERAKKIGTDTVPVARIHTNIPKKIVRTAVAFLFGGDMNISFIEDNDGTEYFRTIVEKKLKMKAVFKEFARTVMVETKAALIFYPKEVITTSGLVVELRVRMLSQKNGEFYPHFDDFGDMDAFTRKYKSVNPDDAKEHDYVWIQTAEQNITSVDMSGTWVTTTEPNVFGKIAVVYAEQELPEWEDVVDAMDALETRFSRLHDTNDYYSEPTLKTFGDTKLPKKNSVGKHIEFSTEFDELNCKMIHGDAEYLTWNQAPESMKLEIDVLINEIFSGTSTPNLSFENLKSVGNITGIGMKFMFMDAFIKAMEKMEIFEPAVQRAAHIIIAGITNICDPGMAGQFEENDVEITFGSVLPDDLREEMEVLQIANGNKPINARRTVTARSRFTKDVDEEMKLIEAEDKAEAGSKNPLGSTFMQ